MSIFFRDADAFIFYNDDYYYYISPNFSQDHRRKTTALYDVLYRLPQHFIIPKFSLQIIHF